MIVNEISLVIQNIILSTTVPGFLVNNFLILLGTVVRNPRSLIASLFFLILEDLGF